jgi:hypothetical protein
MKLRGGNAAALVFRRRKNLAPELLEVGTVQVLLEQNRRVGGPIEGVQRLKPFAVFFVYMFTVANRAKDNK